jgi:hypothetical protein
VVLASGEALDYDYVIYTVGSTGAVPTGVPGAAEYAYPVAEFELAQRLRSAIDGLYPDAPITVVGGGLTRIETAAELAEQGRAVTLVCGGMLAPSLSEPGRRSIAKRLKRMRVNVLETAVVAEERPDSVVLADGAVLPSALTVWTAGFGVPELAARSGLHTDPLGRLLTDATLTSGTVGPAAADELPGSRAGRRAGSRHCATPHRWNRAGGAESGVRGIVCQPGPAGRHDPARAQGRHSSELLHRRAPGRVDQGSGLQGHGVGDPSRSPQARFHRLAQGR